MCAQKDSPTSMTRRHPSHNEKAGFVLILLGLGLAVTFGLQLAWVPAWVAGIGLLVLGAYREKERLIIIGGIATGTGLAIVVQTAPWITVFADQARTGIFLICLSLGWFLITLVSHLATSKTFWWAALPGGVLAISGIAFWVSTGWVKGLSGLVGPVLLTALGLILIFRWNQLK
jgi:hypothetical protein